MLSTSFLLLKIWQRERSNSFIMQMVWCEIQRAKNWNITEEEREERKRKHVKLLHKITGFSRYFIIMGTGGGWSVSLCQVVILYSLLRRQCKIQKIVFEPKLFLAIFRDFVRSVNRSWKRLLPVYQIIFYVSY